MKVIDVQNLKKVFVNKSKKNKKDIFYAIEDLTFSIKEGEKVAFIGPNGAGKSTTIKILIGILSPSSGKVDVLGFVPFKNRKKLAYNIGVLFGQLSQLWYQLSPKESFHLLSKIYDLDPFFFQKHLSELIEIFQVKNFYLKPVKELSLGQRMRCEIIASLLHKPKILFLDEPTIGLDINAKLAIRQVLNDLVVQHKTTLFLTSHDTTDIEQITKRVLVLDKGNLVIDSSINDLKDQYSKKKIITFIVDEKKNPLDAVGLSFIQSYDHSFVYEVDLNLTSIAEVIQKKLKQTHIKDIIIESPSMEKIIKDIYEKF